MQLMGKDKGGRGGTVVVTSSTMGYKPCPSMPIYTATKHALIGFIRSFGVSCIIHIVPIDQTIIYRPIHIIFFITYYYVQIFIK